MIFDPAAHQLGHLAQAARKSGMELHFLRVAVHRDEALRPAEAKLWPHKTTLIQ